MYMMFFKKLGYSYMVTEKSCAAVYQRLVEVLKTNEHFDNTYGR